MFYIMKLYVDLCRQVLNVLSGAAAGRARLSYSLRCDSREAAQLPSEWHLSLPELESVPLESRSSQMRLAHDPAIDFEELIDLHLPRPF